MSETKQKVNDYVVVIGGMNMDIFGMLDNKVIDRDSNIGEIGLTVGGVGQNIAQNLAHLRVPTYLITVYGDDVHGTIMKAECEKNGILLDYAEELKGQRSSSYMYITDEIGDMLLGVNDMKICDKITPDFLANKLEFINQASICLIDANISEDSISWLADHVTVPIFADTVSVTKAPHLKAALGKIDTLKPNALEAGLLTGMQIRNISDAKRAAIELLDTGLKNVYISMGSEGILCANAEEMIHVHTLPTDVINANGAGDCSMATITWCRYMQEFSIRRIGLATQAAASIALESEKSVPDITPELISKKLEHLQITN